MQTIVMAMAITSCTAAMAAESVSVVFPDGDRLTGTIVSQSGDTVVLHHPVLGNISVPASMVQSESAQPESTPSASAEQPQSADPPAAAEAAPAPAKDPTPWTGSISLAATASRAANDTTNIRIGGELHRKSDTDQFDLTGSWYWNQNNGKTIDNDMLIRAAQEWFVTDSRWLYFAQGTWQYDQFEDWGHRVSPYGGVGYKLYQRDDLELTLKVGAGGTWEYKGNRVDPQLLFEANTSWQINDRQSLEGFMSIAPNPLDWGNYLATISIDWKYKLGADTPWSLNLGVRDIYDSQPSGSSTANDFKAYAGLSMEF